MRSRRRLLVAVLAALLPTLACTQPPRSRPGAGGVEERLGAALPRDASFRATDGRALRLGELVGQGKPELLLLAYSRCSMLCSLVLRAAADLVPQLGLTPGRDYDLLTISIDPAETPDEAARTRELVLSRAGLEGAPAWPFLVGAESEIRRVADSVGFSYAWDAASQQFAHPAVLFTLSPEGRVSGYFYDLRPDPAAVRAALLGQTGGAPRSLPAAVLQCFRFDALGRAYGPLVQRCFQVGAALVAIGLGFLVVSLFRRERRLRPGAP